MSRRRSKKERGAQNGCVVCSRPTGKATPFFLSRKIEGDFSL